MKKPGRQAYKKTDLFLCLFFIVFWLLPQVYTNLTAKKIPFVPPFVAALYSTSNLFTRANDLWPMPYIQIRFEANGPWVTVDENEFFRMPTFGYRTRLFEALYLGVDDKQKSAGVQKELAAWIARRYEAAHAFQSVRYVRFVAGLHRAEMGRKVKGHWANPPFEQFTGEDTYELSRHVIQEERHE